MDSQGSGRLALSLHIRASGFDSRWLSPFGKFEYESFLL
jgi:hypothetical protein